MNYNVLQCADGNTIIVSTWVDDPNGARKSRASTVNNLYADPNTVKAVVTVFDEQFNVLDGYKEYIDKTPKIPLMFQVDFNSHGGSEVESQTVLAGETFTEPEAPIREGYTFTGWEHNGYPFDFNMAVNENIVLVATWEKNKVE